MDVRRKIAYIANGKKQATWAYFLNMMLDRLAGKKSGYVIESIYSD